MLPKQGQAQVPRQWIYNLPKYDKQVIHFGFLLGTNTFNFRVRNNPNLQGLDSIYAVQTRPETGFSLGIVSNLHLGNNVDLRFIPGLSFGVRNVKYSVRFTNPKDTTSFLIEPVDKPVESWFLDFPLLLKFKSNRYRNMRAYVLGGIHYTVDLASQAKVPDKGDRSIKLFRSDYGYQLGFGLDFYLQYFKFSPEIRLSMGMRDMVKPENHVFSQSVDALRSQVIFISFLFE